MDDDVVRELGRGGVLAILRYRSGGDVLGALDAVVDGGIGVVEVTVDTPGAWDAIAAAVSRPGVLVGAGTVTEVEQVRRLAGLGGRFVVSPGFDEQVVATALELGLEPLPGVSTATEVMAARRAGARLLKLFPAGALGVRHLRELRGPFGAEHFVPTGGVTRRTLAEWVDAGAYAVALGSDLSGHRPPHDADGRAELTARARETLACVASARSAVDG